MEIRAFRGWRYSVPDGDVSKLIAPPYDVLTAGDKAGLLGGDRRNIVEVDLPHVPPKEVGPEGAYAAAAAALADWKASGLMAQDADASLYAYEQTYTWAGKTHVRRAIIAAVRATALGEDVIPHEHTFAGPKADRLKLTEQTRMQLSPIFGFYDDSAGAAEALWSAAAGEPDLRGELRGVGEKLWAVSDADVIAKVAGALRDMPVFIADGHHRYTTAMNYRDSLGDIPADHPANFVTFVLVAMDDPGLIILPTHRSISGLGDFDFAEFIEATSDVMDYEDVRLRGDDLADVDAYLRGVGPHAMAFAPNDPTSGCIGVPKDLSVMERLAPDECQAWRDLDVSILHRMLIEDRLAPAAGDDMTIEYSADARAALNTVRTGGADLVVFVQATPLAAVKRIATAGAFMPHKSTYFYPKLATGMVLRSVE